MTEELKQIIKEELVNIPKEVLEVISSSSWEKSSEEISKKYNLNDEEINILQGEIALILIGTTEIYELVDNIENNVLVSKNEAKNITEEIINQIIKPISIKITENIKSGLIKRNIHWQQNLDFILSGGNYSAFIKRVENKPNDNPAIINQNIGNSPKTTDLKDSFTI